MSDFVPFHLQILRKCEEIPDKVALIDEDDQLTFGEVRRYSYVLAQRLRELGIEKGSSILVCLPNSVWFPIFFLASAILGATVSACHSKSTKEELAYYSDRCSAALFVCTDANYEKAKFLRIPIVLLDSEEKDEISIPRDLDLEILIDEVDLEAQLLPDDALIQPFSSGTTGEPKCVILTHRNYNAATRGLKEALFNQLLNDLPRSTLAFLPFHHGSGFWALIFCILEGFTSIIQKEFNLQQMYSLIEEHKIDTINVVPSILSLMCKVPSLRDLSSLRTVLCGSAALGEDLSKEFKEKYPMVENLVQGYGMTEVVVLSHITPLGQTEKLGSCGRLIPGFEAKILEESGEEAELMEPGELLIRSDAVMKGYLNSEEKVTDEEGWMRTGDLAYVDSDGFYYIVGRLKETIKVNGMQVSPTEIDSVISSIPGVLQCCVFGIPSNSSGEVPAAVIVIEDKEQEQKIKLSIREKIRESLSPFKQLRGGIAMWDSIPLTPTGKYRRAEIQKRFLLLEEVD